MCHDHVCSVVLKKSYQKKRAGYWHFRLLIYKRFQIKLGQTRNFENISNLKILFALDVLLVKVIYFKIRFCRTCTAWIAISYARPQSIMPAVPKPFGCWAEFAILLASAGRTALRIEKTKKNNNTHTITHVCIPVLLFILYAQKNVCNVIYKTDSYVA